MLTHLLVVILAVTATFADHHDHGEHATTTTEHPVIKCNDVSPLKTLPYTDLIGNWVAVEVLHFKDGHPWSPENDPTPNICIYAKSSDATDHGLKITLESHIPDHPVKTEVVTLTKTGDDNGRLSMVSDSHERENWEAMVLAEQTDKYMVYMMCQPPNEAGDRLPFRVNLFSRHADHSDHDVITDDEELQIERRIGELLHLNATEVKPARLSHSCWASYAEPSTST